MATLTVAILTQNEAKRIGACIRSAQFADQVLVIDGGSTDGTADLARGLGAEVHVYPDWQGFAAQRNRQIAHARGDFILFLDADEEITTELRAELRDVVARNEAAVWSVGWTQVAFGRGKLVLWLGFTCRCCRWRTSILLPMTSPKSWRS